METIYLNLTEPQNGLHIEQLGHSTCTRHYGDMKTILGLITFELKPILEDFIRITFQPDSICRESAKINFEPKSVLEEKRQE